MIYNWQQEDWPEFSYNSEQIGDPGLSFGIKSGEISGIMMGLSEVTKTDSIIEMMVTEAVKTSQIEGELLNRDDVMSSIQNNLGLHNQSLREVKDLRAKGIAELMVSIRSTFNKPLSEKMLFEWHNLLMMGNNRITSGKWRRGEEAMQIVSGSVGKEIVHFEAPPSLTLPFEMKRFISWFNRTSPGKPNAIDNALVRSAIAHLYFESIHPFEDGNGRIGRALSEKALSQGIGSPIYLSLSNTIEKEKKAYYQALKIAQKSNEITSWLRYFIKTIFQAQNEATEMITFSLKKAKFYDQYKDVLNSRQTKVTNRFLEEWPDGFKGGMTARKYMDIAKTSKATATRDMQFLVELGIFIPSGGGRSTRYELKI